jgi:L-arabinokinase
LYRITHGSALDLADVESFVDTLNGLDRHATEGGRAFFDAGADLVVTRAPGRLDVMGGIADYSGSLVLQLPIKEATRVALQRRAAPELHIISLGADENDRKLSFRMPLSEFEQRGGLIEYETARARFRRDPGEHWAAYVAGVFLVLQKERQVVFPEGARLLIQSDVPEGKGVSSSAAIEVAVMKAVAAAYGIDLEARELALLCQKVENLVVGAPCGVMDQMTASCGEAKRLLALLCQPAELQGSVALPEGVGVWGLDSGVRHSVSGENYGSVRIGAFMGYRIIAELAGLRVKTGEAGEPAEIDDRRWGGYLANLSPSAYEEGFAGSLPDQVHGRTFLKRYGNTTDTVTQVDPDRHYPVRVATAHPVFEHWRVRTYAELLSGSVTERRLELLGELMYQSHGSYSACGLGSEETDRLVELVRKAGPEQGLYGAKITGGGSGGTVAVLGRRGADRAVEALAEEYRKETGHASKIFSGSSVGAARFGHLKLRSSA